MSNVLINGRTAVHAGSGGVLNTVDICKTKVGSSIVPIPYPNVAVSQDADNTAATVFINGEPACHASSIFASSTGDQPGSRGGIRSGDTQGEAEFITSSPNVYIEGEPAVRMGDLMVSNDGNTPPAPLMQAGAPMPPEIEALITQESEAPTPDSIDVTNTHQQQTVMQSEPPKEPPQE